MLETFDFENYGQTSYKVAFVNSRFHKLKKLTGLHQEHIKTRSP